MPSEGKDAALKVIFTVFAVLLRCFCMTLCCAFCEPLSHCLSQCPFVSSILWPPTGNCCLQKLHNSHVQTENEFGCAWSLYASLKMQAPRNLKIDLQCFGLLLFHFCPTDWTELCFVFCRSFREEHRNGLLYVDSIGDQTSDKRNFSFSKRLGTDFQLGANPKLRKHDNNLRHNANLCPNINGKPTLTVLETYLFVVQMYIRLTFDK